MIGVDASVLVSVYWTGDAHHQASRAWLAAYLSSDETLVAPFLILSEVAGAITRRTGDPALGHEAVQQVREIPRLTLVPIDEDIGTFAAALAADLRLHGADAVYVAVAARRNVPLITWDRTQLERGGQRVVTRRPSDI